MMGQGKSWVEVSQGRLKGNFERLRGAAGKGVALLSVVKADAYGHGAAICSPVLAAFGTDWLGVTDAAEGVLVQEALWGGPPRAIAGVQAAGCEAPRSPTAGREGGPGVLILCGLLPEDADLIVARGLTAVVWTRWQTEALEAAVRRSWTKNVDGRRVPMAVHLELDTGMSRQGVQPGAALDAMLAWLQGSECLRLDGVLTHFASAEIVGSGQTSRQRQRFAEGMRQVREAGFRPGWVHAGNTSALDNAVPVSGERSHVRWLRYVAETVGARPMARAGLALYGCSLPLQQAAQVHGAAEPREVRDGEGLRLAASEDILRVAGERDGERLEGALQGLAPALTWKTRVIDISHVRTGACVGYNATYVARGAMRLALLPVGYADGLRRELSGSEGREGGWVMVRGRRAPIVGRVSMNLTTVDVTGIESVAEGDEATLLGEGVSAEDHARLAGTIAYEILCGVRSVGRSLVD